ncbi:MAG: branched-chain amino acid ABC transporter permease [Candidatus Limnocylindria bacterium]
MTARLRGIDRNLLGIAFMAVVLLPVPVVLSGSNREIAVRVLLFALLASAWNLMGGFAGLFSFGHAAFFGIGAYTTAYLLVEHDVSPWLGMAAGGALAAAFAVATGFLAFRYRLRHAYFALATFAFAEMLRLVAVNLDLIKGSLGIQVPRLSEPSWTMLQFAPNSPNYFFAALILLVAALTSIVLLMRSRSGWVTLAMRDDEEAAESLGVHAMRHKLTIAAASGALTAVGGAFYFQFVFFIDPDLAFGSSVSVEIFLGAIIGGTGTIWGPVVGAFLFVLLGEFTSWLVRDPPTGLSFLEGRSGLDLLLYGLIIVVIILFFPRGVLGSLTSRGAR